MERMDILGVIDFSIWWCKFSLGFNDYCHKDLLSSPFELYDGEVDWFDFSMPEIMFTVVVIIVFIFIRNSIDFLFPRFSNVLHKFIIFGSLISLLVYVYYLW